ncbi:hypothetical protein KUTeg_011107 [Tegillarca granosa]|uniref:Uncharacterized protein n=1 Tax=Tegillarca granosa TaxID=220873 RepID=A0ABQ9F2Y8_TEGGR|nr:hypothetical protein KUTeg_011107 [Tegillarca granosa]
MYSFITSVNQVMGYNDVKIPDTWNLISWLLSGLPYIAIPAAAIHACDDDDDRDRRGYAHPPEPTAPPYSYMDSHGYMDSMYPLDDLHKAQYDSDMEPLNTTLRQSRI